MKLTALKWARLKLFSFSVLFSFFEITFRSILIFIKFLFTELGGNSGIGKLFTNAMESLDEEDKDYYFSNSDSA